MRRRIFIAINLPDNIKESLEKNRYEIESLFPEEQSRGMIRWVKKENLHITLLFLGYLSDEEVGEVCKNVKKAVSEKSVFSLKLEKISYGPPEKIPPLMIWAVGEKTKEIVDLKGNMEGLLISPAVKFGKENRGFKIHITLARIRAWQWRKIEPEERPEIEREISLDFEVNSIEVMESKLGRGGAKYMVLESVKLKK